MQRVLSALLIVAGVVLAGWVVLDDTGDDVGTLTVGTAEPPVAADAPEPEPTNAPEPDPSPVETVEPEDEPSEEPTPDDPDDGEDTDRAATGVPGGIPPVTVRTGGLGEVDLSRPPAPRRIDVPSLGIDAPVVPVGVESDGNIFVPEDVSVIGWYQGSRAPAEQLGNTVLIGHVDSRTQGKGAFFDLRIAEVGAEIALTDDDGAESVWQVTGRRTFEKTAIPMDDINQYYGERRLLLITCGGEFDRAAGRYESIVIVQAELLS